MPTSKPNLPANTKPRVLVLDIETGPGKGYIWSLFDTYMPLERLISPVHMLCYAAKFVGEPTIYFGATWITDRKTMLERLTALLNEADAVVTFNGDKFDLRKIRGEVIAAGVTPYAKLTSIDLYKTVKMLGYTSGKLEYIGPFLKIGAKKKHAGFALWRAVLEGDERAQNKMMLYNVQDVRLTERLYKKLRPYMDNHPHLVARARTSCPNCGGKHLQHRGFRYTRTFKIERLQCQNGACMAWSTGSRSKIK
jgi:hypothetical protein